MAEQMNTAIMKRMLIDAYNATTFKNALMCALDYVNYYHCTHLHEDTDLYVDEDGFIVDTRTKVTDSWIKKTSTPRTPAANGWQERWKVGDTNSEKLGTGKEVKIKLVKDYSGYHSYTAVANPSGNPKAQGWYEKNSFDDSYFKTIDRTVFSGKTYYSDGGANPKQEGWFEKDLNDISSLTDDTSVVDGKNYYTTKKGSKYAYYMSTDSEMEEGKKYYRFKAASAHKESLPDYTGKYVCNIDFSKIPGIDKEVTLYKRRPATEE